MQSKAWQSKAMRSKAKQCKAMQSMQSTAEANKAEAKQKPSPVITDLIRGVTLFDRKGFKVLLSAFELAMPKYDRRYLAERQLFNHTKHFTAMMC